MSSIAYFEEEASIGEWIGFTLVCCIGGLAMGLVGVGAVVIVPAAIAILRFNAKLAVASAIAGYILTSLSGIWSYRSVIIEYIHFVWLLVCGTCAGGFVAAFALRSLPSGPLVIFIACFCIVFGIKALLQSIQSGMKSGTVDSTIENDANKVNSNCSFELPVLNCRNIDVEEKGKVGNAGSTSGDDSGGRYTLNDMNTAAAVLCIVVGFIVGFCSALTGTAGPLVCIPTIMLIYPTSQPSDVVALSMVIGVPMAVAMTAGNMYNGQTVDLGMSLVVGLATAVCIPIGAALSGYVRQNYENGEIYILGGIAIVLLVTGCWVLVIEIA
jgi:uncharacterized membrane protein YfcA